MCQNCVFVQLFWSLPICVRQNTQISFLYEISFPQYIYLESKARWLSKLLMSCMVEPLHQEYVSLGFKSPTKLGQKSNPVTIISYLFYQRCDLNSWLEKQSSLTTWYGCSLSRTRIDLEICSVADTGLDISSYSLFTLFRDSQLHFVLIFPAWGTGYECEPIVNHLGVEETFPPEKGSFLWMHRMSVRPVCFW